MMIVLLALLACNSLWMVASFAPISRLATSTDTHFRIRVNQVNQQVLKTVSFSSDLNVDPPKQQRWTHTVQQKMKQTVSATKIPKIFELFQKYMKRPAIFMVIIASAIASMFSKTTSQHAVAVTQQETVQKRFLNPKNNNYNLKNHEAGSLVASSSSHSSSSHNAAIKPSKPASFQALQQVGVEQEVVQEVERSWNKLTLSLQGVKLDSIIMLIATSAVIPLFKMLNVSPIVGFLLTGTLIGPGGLNLVRDVHLVDMLGELGIVFFLFEMGLELSLDRLKSMRQDVFGLGSSQFLLTSAVVACAARVFGKLSVPAAVTIGGSLALSSSAFVLQLLKDQDAMGTKHGKASFGILLLQDLAVVPLLVVVELLGEGGAGLGKALSIAGLKAVVTLSTLSFLGKRFLDPIFSVVARSRSQEAFLSIILSTVFVMSFVTQGIGLSDTLGAFLAGILLSETSYRYQIEADISVFRGFLLGLFFMTVGFKLDIGLLWREWPKILFLLTSLVATKAGITTLLARLFGVPLASAQQCGILTAQAGEFAFVSLGIAQRMGLLTPQITQLLLTTVAVSMALTPVLAEAGSALSNVIEQKQQQQKQQQQQNNNSHDNNDNNNNNSNNSSNNNNNNNNNSEIDVSNVVILCGYGRVGKLVAGLLDRKFIPYIAFDNDPQRVVEARNKGLPVYYGDVNRPDMLKHFHLEEAKACVITFAGIGAINKAVIRLRKLAPALPIVARATDPNHQQRLENMFDNLQAINPVIPEDSLLLMLPFGGAVLEQVGVPETEVDAILDDVRQECMEKEEQDHQHHNGDTRSSNDNINSNKANKKKSTNLAIFKLFRPQKPAAESAAPNSSNNNRVNNADATVASDVVTDTLVLSASIDEQNTDHHNNSSHESAVLSSSSSSSSSMA